MGIYNREYLRGENENRNYSNVEWQGWKVLLAITIVVFVAQILTIQRGAFHAYSLVTEWLHLSTTELMHGQIWRVVTYIFCHDIHSLWHVFFNMLALYMFAPEIEHRIGKREFILFYLIAGIMAGLTEIGLSLLTNIDKPMVGASGSVMGVSILYAYWYPDRILYIYIFPVRARILAFIIVGIDLLPVLHQLSGSNPRDSIAHAAHLGGALFGYLYGHNQLYFSSYFSWFSGSRGNGRKRGSFFSKKPALRYYNPDDEEDKSQSHDSEDDIQMKKRVDEILSKIFDQGEASLTAEERDFMQKASQRLQKKLK